MRWSAQARTGERWTWDDDPEPPLEDRSSDARVLQRARALLTDPAVGAVAVWDGERFTTWRRPSDVPEAL
jgi:hypothetical protein